MSELKELVRVFVYGTLKPGEANYQHYCTERVVEVTRAIARGQLFALPLGYPAMTQGESLVHGFLLSFPNSDIFHHLDWLEDYDPKRPAAQNEYNRHQIEIYDTAMASLGTASVYLMTPRQVHSYGGIFLPNGWWSGCGLTPANFFDF